MCAYLFDATEMTEEEVDEIIEKAAEKIHKYGMNTVAILALESVKPLAYVGGEMSRLMIAPFLAAFGPDTDMLGEKLIYVFEDRRNLDKLIDRLEEISRENDRKKAEKKAEEKERSAEKNSKAGKKEKPKKSWRDWLPF
jgi:uncharacterized membrane protein